MAMDCNSRFPGWFLSSTRASPCPQPLLLRVLICHHVDQPFHRVRRPLPMCRRFRVYWELSLNTRRRCNHCLLQPPPQLDLHSRPPIRFLIAFDPGESPLGVLSPPSTSLGVSASAPARPPRSATAVGHTAGSKCSVSLPDCPVPPCRSLPKPLAPPTSSTSATVAHSPKYSPLVLVAPGAQSPTTATKESFSSLEPFMQVLILAYRNSASASL